MNRELPLPALALLGRRDALRLLGAAVGAFAVSGCADASAQAPAVRLGPWPARPGQTTMSLWCDAAEGAVTSACIGDAHGAIFKTAPFVRIADDLWLAEVHNLVSDTAYTFRVVDSDGLTHHGRFRTLPLADGVLTLAFGADIHPDSKPYVAFDRIREASPHAYIGLGDQVYADIGPNGVTAANAASYAALYRATWDDPALRACWASLPAVLVWDDHEIWNDYDGSANTDRFPAALASYADYQRSRQSDASAWTVLDCGPASVFMLDTRSFRDANEAPDGPHKTMLGSAQFDALTSFITTSAARVRIIASPTPFTQYVTTGRDGWAQGFPSERDRLFQLIADHDPATVVLVTGDQHWPGVFKHTLPNAQHVYELLATPVAAFFRPPPTVYGADALYVDGDHMGYGSLTVDGRSDVPKVDYRWIDEVGHTRFSLSVI